MVRSREKTTTGHYTLINGSSYPIEWVDRLIVEGTYPGSCSLWHYKYRGWNGTVESESGGERTTFVNYPGDYSSALVYSMGIVHKELTRLNWNKLPSSSKAGIIQILAELDDTIALFTLRFWKSLSYGSITWGVLPFVQDLQAVATTCRNLTANLAQFSYEDSYSVNIPSQPDAAPNTYGYRVLSGTCLVRKTGLGDISFHHPGSIALDRLGFHPDLATAWDLIPLSFLVDYLLPIGDYLESLRMGGWVKTMLFQGWVTSKFAIDCEYYNTQTGYIGLRAPYKMDVFRRFSMNDVLIADFTPPTQLFKVPNLKQLFNLLYVLVLNKRHA